MSNECSTIVWKRDFGSLTRKVIAARLADHADDEGRGIWPSVDRVAAQCNASIRTVQRTLSEFVDEGILKIISEGGRGPGSTRRYDFNMRVLEGLPLAAWGAETKGVTVSPLEIKGDSDDAKGDSDDIKGCHGGTQTSIEPPLEPSIEKNACEAIEEKEDRRVLEKSYMRLTARPIARTSSESISVKVTSRRVPTSMRRFHAKPTGARRSAISSRKMATGFSAPM